LTQNSSEVYPAGESATSSGIGQPEKGFGAGVARLNVSLQISPHRSPLINAILGSWKVPTIPLSFQTPSKLKKMKKRLKNLSQRHKMEFHLSSESMPP
jgi:hypothetical protein